MTKYGDTLPLFDNVQPDREPTKLPSAAHVRPPVAKRNDPITSHAAASDARKTAAKHRAVILQLLDAYPPGLTADRIDAAMGWRTGTAGKRLSDMVRAKPVPLVKAATHPVTGEPLAARTRTGSYAQIYVRLPTAGG